MPVHCGVDIVEIERIKSSLEGERGQAFRKRIFTEAEIAYCEGRNKARFESYAARFAAKEAVSKALGTGISEGINWRDIEILKDGKGKPFVRLEGKARERFDLIKGLNISVSLSHCKSYAVACAVIETAE